MDVNQMSAEGRFLYGKKCQELGKELDKSWHQDIKDGYKLAVVRSKDDNLVQCVQSLMAACDKGGAVIHVSI